MSRPSVISGDVGNVAWKGTPSISGGFESITLGDDRVFFVTGNADIGAFAKSDGSEEWLVSYSTDTSVDVHITYARGDLYVAGSDADQLYRYSVTDGSVKESFTLSAFVKSFDPAYGSSEEHGLVFVQLNNSNNPTEAVDISGGSMSQAWLKSLGQIETFTSSSEGIFACSFERIKKLSVSDGSVISSVNRNSIIPISNLKGTTYHRGSLWVVQDGKVVTLDPDTLELTSFVYEEFTEERSDLGFVRGVMYTATDQDSGAAFAPIRPFRTSDDGFTYVRYQSFSAYTETSDAEGLYIDRNYIYLADNPNNELVASTNGLQNISDQLFSFPVSKPVDLRWVPVDNADEYIIRRRSKHTDSFTQIDTVTDSVASSYTDSSLSVGDKETYEYEVEAVKSGTSNKFPRVVKIFNDTESVLLQWGRKDVDSYNVYKGGSQVDTIDGKSGYYLDHDVSLGQNYTYSVEAVDYDGTVTSQVSTTVGPIEEPTGDLAKPSLFTVQLPR